jgi:hypothetical protein
LTEAGALPRASDSEGADIVNPSRTAGANQFAANAARPEWQTLDGTAGSVPPSAAIARLSGGLPSDQLTPLSAPENARPVIAPTANLTRDPTQTLPPEEATPPSAAAPQRFASINVGPAPRTPTPEAQETVTPGALSEFIGKFLAGYSEGDLVTLMDLFSTDAKNNRGGREAIRLDYDRLFDASRARSLSLAGIVWREEDRQFVGQGRFVATVQPMSGAPREVRGAITIVVVLEQGRPRIRELRHEND